MEPEGSLPHSQEPYTIRKFLFSRHRQPWIDKFEYANRTQSKTVFVLSMSHAVLYIQTRIYYSSNLNLIEYAMTLECSEKAYA